MQAKEEFKKWWRKQKFNPRVTFSEFAAKHTKDSRFKAIEKMKDREALFNEFVAAARKKEEDWRQEVRRLNGSLNYYLIITWTVDLDGAK